MVKPSGVRMPRGHALVTLFVFGAALALLAELATPTPAPAVRTTGALALPATRLEFGLSNGPGEDAWMTGSGVPWKYRYTYLSAGVNTGAGWETWNSPAGQYATLYMNASYADGYIPVFPYYELLQSNPSTGSNESDKDFSNLNNASTMAAYYANFKLLMQKAGAFGHTVVVHVEPDLWGYLEQRALPGDASSLTASVASSGTSELAGMPNSVQGFAWALLRLRDLYAPNALLAIHASAWGSGQDIAGTTDAALNIVTEADKTAAFLNSAGITSNPYGSTWDLVFNDVDDHDAAWWEAQGADNAYFTHWWDPTNTKFPNFTRYLAWVSELHTKTARPQIVWQVPEGNQYFLTENNTCGHYQDNLGTYFIAHASDLFNAGLIAVLFGAGNGCQTNNTDVRGDGVTNNGGVPTTDTLGGCSACNTHTSTYSDDDGGYLRQFVGQYYSSAPGAPTGVVATPGDGSVNLSWTAPASSGASAITSYIVTAYDGCTIQGSITVSGSPPATSTTFPNLTNGSAYTFTVSAVNSNGTGPASAPSASVVPSGPTAPAWLSACSTSQYSLTGNNGASWVNMDLGHLSLTFTPAAASFAVITANSDLWTQNAGYNQDIGVAVSGGAYPTTINQPEAWKESGGFAGTFSPNAAFVQTVIPVSASTTYAVRLQWKANQSDPGTIMAGAGPTNGAYSPTRLTVRLIPNSSNTVFTRSIVTQPCLRNNDGSSWNDLDPGLSTPFTPPAGNWLALITGNADMFTSTAGYNQDLGIGLSGGVYPTVGGQPEAWKESGGYAGTYSPNAAFVQAALPVTGGTPYTANVLWKANKGSTGWIHIGAGPIGSDFSRTRITVILVPNPGGATAASSKQQFVQQNSDGTTWNAMNLASLAVTVSPSVSTSYEISANSDLWTAQAGYNQDIGIMATGGAYGTIGTLVAWKESGGFGGTFSPNAALVTTDLHLQAGNTYHFWIVWKANHAGYGNRLIYAGAGPIGSAFSPTSLVAVALSQP